MLDVVQVGIVALLDGRIIGLACNIKQAGDFATIGRRLRREPVPSFL